MKAHEKLPSLEEIKEHAKLMRELVAGLKQRDEEDREKSGNAIKEYIDSLNGHIEELKFMKDVEALQAAKLAKMATELEAVKAKLEAAESESARLEQMAMEGAESLARERTRNEQIKAAVREFVESHLWNDALRKHLATERLVALDKTT